MTKIKKIVLCMGTRAEIIKLAPVYYALKELGASVAVWHIGQHEELAWPFFEFFNIQPEKHLIVNRKEKTLGHLSSLIIKDLDHALNDADVSCLVVQGDTTTAFISALTAFYHQIPVAHVEAGLRTFQTYDPFPEEKNRELISRLAKWHFAPADKAKKNLKEEGIGENSIYTVGNTIVDAALWGISRLEKEGNILSADSDFPGMQYDANISSRRLILVTAHRRENWDSGIEKIAASVKAAVRKYNDVFVVWPVHPNPLIKTAILKQIESLGNEARRRILLTEPVSYPVMLTLLKDAWLIMTDSGGIQEEAITLGVPVLVLRETTERPEVIDAGGGVVVGVEKDNVLYWLDKLDNNPDIYRSMKNCQNPYGDGQASRMIAQILTESLH